MATRHALPAVISFVHVALPADQRWRCAVKDRGVGVVVARTDLVGSPTGYDVALDAGGLARVLPADLRPLLHLVRA